MPFLLNSEVQTGKHWVKRGEWDLQRTSRRESNLSADALYVGALTTRLLAPTTLRLLNILLYCNNFTLNLQCRNNIKIVYFYLFNGIFLT